MASLTQTGAAAAEIKIFRQPLLGYGYCLQHNGEEQNRAVKEMH